MANNDYSHNRKNELLWYGFSQERAESLALENGDVVLATFGIAMLVLNDDLRYIVKLREASHGLEEMRELHDYLQEYKPALALLSSDPGKKQLVPPGRILTRDGDIVYFLYEEGEHIMILEQLRNEAFNISEIAAMVTFLEHTCVLRSHLERRNELDFEMKHGDCCLSRYPDQ